MADQNISWTVTYMNPKGSQTIEMVSASEPALANLQVIDKTAISLSSVLEAHRNVYRVSYNVRGISDPRHVNVVAFDPTEATAHLGEVDNASITNIASNVHVAGLDKPLGHKLPVTAKPAPVHAPASAPTDQPKSGWGKPAK